MSTHTVYVWFEDLVVCIIWIPYSRFILRVNNIFARSNRSAKFSKNFSREINQLYGMQRCDGVSL